MYLPTFDGSSKCMTRAWVEKLDTYFQLSQMIEVEGIKMTTLHLKGETHDWWFHGLTMLGHANDFLRQLHTEGCGAF